MKDQTEAQIKAVEETIKSINREIWEYKKGVDNSNAFMPILTCW